MLRNICAESASGATKLIFSWGSVKSRYKKEGEINYLERANAILKERPFGSPIKC